MRTKFTLLAALTAAALLFLPACQANNNMKTQAADGKKPAARQQAADDKIKANSLTPHRIAGHGDPRAIPGADGAKTRTTNEFGGTSYGLGSSVYSVIGSSGLHSQGLSSHIESRLSGAGLSDIRVFALDDMVILAAKKSGTSAYRYDTMQQKLLSGTAGMSGHGPEAGPGVNVGTTPAGDGATHDDMEQAKRWIKDNMGDVKIYAVTSPEAVRTIDRIRSNAGSASPRQTASDIQKLLQLAMGSK
ncbi:hypothetical protein [Cohnella caldifontis]|uniref:hypothetical protein n=1 Tax=Cohnella caldifontis TaxID=3027471 RepID=UPI0023EDEB86|nr:hypothetical protein [Cohnella sp. YIM B05605]